MAIDRARSPRLVIVLAGALLVGGVFLVVQDQRHGWPFSRHHGLASPVPPSAPIGKGAPAGASRVPIVVDRAHLEAAGVRYERAQRTLLTESLRAVATVVADESRVSHVHTRVSGWIERLYVNTTGQRVRAGERLAEVFSQELLSSQNEYLTALRASAAGLSSAAVEAGRARLDVLGMSEREVADIERSGRPHRTVTIVAPHGGTVLRRGVSVGTAIDPSTEIMTVADLSLVWVLAEVPEAVGDRIAVGSRASLEFPGSGRPRFAAPVEFVYPTLTERTRQSLVRFVVGNDDGRLPPGAYGTATFEIGPREALTVPRDAVVDTGITQYVFVRTPANVLEPRPVKLGARQDERIEVLSGLSFGDEVVATGVFLIDSESRLRASEGGAAHGHGTGGQTPPASQTGQPRPTAHAEHGG